MGWLGEGLGWRGVPELNGSMTPVPQLARIFMDVNELSSRGETENKIVVCRMTHADVWPLIRFV